MNKSKIEWLQGGATWNPVTGCKHGCPYCYARKYTHRFGFRIDADPGHGLGDRQRVGKECECNTLHILREKPKNSYLYGFDPTFHRYRLEEPQKIKKPQNIFVCSMADLFGDWVPDEWIQMVFDACKAAPQHRYLFLTKNPERYNYINCDGQTLEGCKKCNECEGEHRIITIYRDNEEPFPELYLGASATDSDSLHRAYDSTAEWVSIEPLLDDVYDECFSQDGETPAGYREWARWKWVVIGAESGNRKGKVIPKKEWVQNIVDMCKSWNTPVFMKDSLKEIWKESLIQEYPW